MRIIEFPYVLHKGLLMPIIPLSFKGVDRWFRAWALVDSGAVYSIFHPKELTGTGLDYTKGLLRMVVVGDGSFIPVYFLKLPVRLGDVEFEAEIGFSERLGVGFNLLGRKGFFEKFEICFNEAEGRISFLWRAENS